MPPRRDSDSYKINRAFLDRNDLPPYLQVLITHERKNLTKPVYIVAGIFASFWCGYATSFTRISWSIVTGIWCVILIWLFFRASNKYDDFVTQVRKVHELEEQSGQRVVKNNGTSPHN